MDRSSTRFRSLSMTEVRDLIFVRSTAPKSILKQTSGSGLNKFISRSVRFLDFQIVPNVMRRSVSKSKLVEHIRMQQAQPIKIPTEIQHERKIRAFLETGAKKYKPKYNNLVGSMGIPSFNRMTGSEFVDIIKFVLEKKDKDAFKGVKPDDRKGVIQRIVELSKQRATAKCRRSPFNRLILLNPLAPNTTKTRSIEFLAFLCD